MPTQKSTELNIFFAFYLYRTQSDNTEEEIEAADFFDAPDLLYRGKYGRGKYGAQDAGKQKQGQEPVAEDGWQPLGEKTAQQGAAAYRQSVYDVKIRDAARPLLRHHGIIYEIEYREVKTRPDETGKELDHDEICDILREEP